VYCDTEPPIVTLGMSGQLIKERRTARQVMEELLTPAGVARMERELAGPNGS
jgi:hypothetical protein